MKVPATLTLLQINPAKAVDLNGGITHGWLYYEHPDGYWITERKLDIFELMAATDQRDAGIVIDKKFSPTTCNPEKRVP